MNVHSLTTPFGGRSMTLAMIESHKQTQQLTTDKTADKWQIYRWLCEGRALIGIGDRTLSVLNALLTFYPETVLTEENGLIVFPSNAQLSLRAHGMTDGTLRRHLASLVNAGLILRKDSPNGKRYARKNRAGEIAEAFGFSLAPLLVRAEEFEIAAEQVREEARELRATREQISLYRRDITKLIETALVEGFEGNWQQLWTRFRGMVDILPRRASVQELKIIAHNFAQLYTEVNNILNSNVKTQEMHANAPQSERQQSNSDTYSIFESKTSLEKIEGEKVKSIEKWPLEFILKTCPDIKDYASDGINSWRDFMATASQVRRYLDISPSAYQNALDVLGQENTATVIAYILQRAHDIRSAGGYLRALTDKARMGGFTIEPMLLSSLKSRGYHQK